MVLLPFEEEATDVALATADCVLVGLEVGSIGRLKLLVGVGVLLLSLGLAFGEP